MGLFALLDRSRYERYYANALSDTPHECLPIEDLLSFISHCCESGITASFELPSALMVLAPRDSALLAMKHDAVQAPTPRHAPPARAHVLRASSRRRRKKESL